MSDIRTVMFRPFDAGEAPFFDWSEALPSLADDDGLETAVILSLFTDRRAADDDALPDGTDDRRGWWGDAYPDLPGDRVGSRLWLLFREKDMQAVVNRAREYVEEALAWLVEDGIARRVVVQTGWVDRTSGALSDIRTINSRPGVLGIGITIYRPDTPPDRFKFETFWSR
ncbi:MAG: phage GP46 family protein [Gammaproteobacteria bacterium]